VFLVEDTQEISMKSIRKPKLLAAALICAALATAQAQAPDPLSRWNDGKTKHSIIAFVEKVTKKGSPDFVPIAERIAAFDNHGTLWAEQPMYSQLLFALDRVETLFIY